MLSNGKDKVTHPGLHGKSTRTVGFYIFFYAFSHYVLLHKEIIDFYEMEPMFVNPLFEYWLKTRYFPYATGQVL